MDEFKVIKGTITAITYNEEVPYVTLRIKDDDDKYIKCCVVEDLFYIRTKQIGFENPLGFYCAVSYDERENNNVTTIFANEIVIQDMNVYNDRNKMKYISKAFMFVPDCVERSQDGKVATISDYLFENWIEIDVTDITDQMKLKLFNSSLYRTCVMFFTDYDNICYKVAFMRDKYHPDE